MHTVIGWRDQGPNHCDLRRFAVCPELLEARVLTPANARNEQKQMLASYVRAFREGSLFVMQISILALATKVIVRDFALSSGLRSASRFADRSMLGGFESPVLPPSRRNDFHRDEVLNHRIGSDGTLRRGDLLEGVLLSPRVSANPAVSSAGKLHVGQSVNHRSVRRCVRHNA